MQIPTSKLKIDGNHVYTTPAGQVYTGVTTITGLLDKKFLMYWTVKEMYNDLLEKRETVQNAGKTEYKNLLEEAKKAHARKAKEARDTGTEVHDAIERYVKKQAGQETEESDEELSAQAKKCFTQFMDWESNHDIEWIASEHIVSSDEYRYAGTVDAIAMVDGEPTIIDFKTSNQVSEEAFLQTAAYLNALQEMGFEAKNRMIVRIPKDGSKYEAGYVPTPYDLDLKTFLALREGHKFASYIKNHGKKLK